VKFIQHGNIPLWAGWRLAGGLLGCLLGLKIGFRGLAYWQLPAGFENRLAGRCRDPYGLNW